MTNIEREMELEYAKNLPKWEKENVIDYFSNIGILMSNHKDDKRVNKPKLESISK